MEPLYNRHFRTRYFWQLFAIYTFIGTNSTYYGGFFCVLNSEGLLREIPLYICVYIAFAISYIVLFHFKEKNDLIASTSKEKDHDASINLVEKTEVDSLLRKLKDLENYNKSLQEKLENVLLIIIMHMYIYVCTYMYMCSTAPCTLYLYTYTHTYVRTCVYVHYTATSELCT